MENASNAIKIAGELLIGLLLISLFIFVFQKIGSLEDEKSQQIAITQTEEFNRKFNAYDKTQMYGTDLISILGLAFSNNMTVNLAKYKSSDPKNGYYDPELANSINIIFKISEPITKKIVSTKKTFVDGELVKTSEPETVKDTVEIFSKGEHSLSGQKNGNTISRTKDVENIYTILIKGQDTKVTTSSGRATTYNGKGAIEYTETVETISGFSELKKKIFECKEVKYNDVGRIYSMRFEEKQ